MALETKFKVLVSVIIGFYNYLTFYLRRKCELHVDTSRIYWTTYYIFLNYKQKNWNLRVESTYGYFLKCTKFHK